MDPLVSVVIPTFNHGHLVEQAVASVFAQSYPNTELIVIDDGSTDDTRERLASFDGSLRYVHQENRGLSTARNAGIALAKGEFIALLDADDRWMPEKIARQVAVFKEQDQVGVVSCWGLQVSSDGKELGPSKRYPCAGEKGLRRLLQGNCVSGGSNAVVKKECFEKLGGFDESLTSSEDWDMWLRIVPFYPIQVVEAQLVLVRQGEINMSAPRNCDRMLQNEITVLEKFFRSHPSLPEGSRSWRSKALSERYVAAAWASVEDGRVSKARRYIRQAFFADPRALVDRRRLGLLLRVLKASVGYA